MPAPHLGCFRGKASRMITCRSKAPFGSKGVMRWETTWGVMTFSYLTHSVLISLLPNEPLDHPANMCCLINLSRRLKKEQHGNIFSMLEIFEGTYHQLPIKASRHYSGLKCKLFTDHFGKLYTLQNEELLHILFFFSIIAMQFESLKNFGGWRVFAAKTVSLLCKHLGLL